QASSPRSAISYFSASARRASMRLRSSAARLRFSWRSRSSSRCLWRKASSSSRARRSSSVRGRGGEGGRVAAPCPFPLRGPFPWRRVCASRRAASSAFLTCSSFTSPACRSLSRRLWKPIAISRLRSSFRGVGRPNIPTFGAGARAPAVVPNGAVRSFERVSHSARLGRCATLRSHFEAGGAGMLRRLFPIVAIAFTACVFPWGECLDEDSASSGPEARCSPEVSRALRVLDDAHRGLWEFLPHWPPGEVSGEVISADERRLQIGIEGELRTLTWPQELPFAVDVGEPVAIRVGHESVTLLFEGGTLSYHAGAGFSGPGEVHIGELAVQWESDEYGCASDRGAALNLLVGETRIAPGERRTIREWTFTNLGAFSTAGEERCGTVVEGSYVGAWMAERPNGVQECFGPPMQGEPCGESVAALLQGEAFAPESWTAHEGPYTVSEVEEDSF